MLAEPRLRLRGALTASIAGSWFASLVLVPVALGRVGFSAIGTVNLLLLLGGGVASAMVGGLGRTRGGVVLAVLVALVALATVREAVGAPAPDRVSTGGPQR